jgi:hypothetical protein
MTGPLDRAPTSSVAMVLLPTQASTLPLHKWSVALLHSIFRVLNSGIQMSGYHRFSPNPYQQT